MPRVLPYSVEGNLFASRAHRDPSRDLVFKLVPFYFCCVLSESQSIHFSPIIMYRNSDKLAKYGLSKRRCWCRFLTMMINIWKLKRHLRKLFLKAVEAFMCFQKKCFLLKGSDRHYESEQQQNLFVLFSNLGSIHSWMPLMPPDLSTTENTIESVFVGMSSLRSQAVRAAQIARSVTSSSIEHFALHPRSLLQSLSCT